MRLKLTLPIVAMMAMQAAGALALDVDLSGYQEENGAITSWFHGDTIDPYFATKALLLAKDGDLNARKQSLAWVKWALHAQRGDGLFNRYKRDITDNNWKVVAASDADDAMLALWIELLYRLSPSQGMPAQWQDSLNRAEERLDELFDEDSGIYHISTALPVGLLMDNMEIYASLSHSMRECKRLGLKAKAKEYQDRLDELRDGINQTFGIKDGVYAISTQPRDKDDFYPDKVAQVFPILYRFAEGAQARQIFENWLKNNGKEWIEQRTNDYPWGLVAITALDMGDADSASCWQNRAEPMRYSGHWNILEEVALQSVKYRLSLQKYDKIPCVWGGLV